MTWGYRPPRPIRADDDADHFTCASTEQTNWIRRYAEQSSSGGTTRVFVITSGPNDAVVGYFAWRMAQIDIGDAPERARKGAGQYPQPVALLARLGVDEEHVARGLGAALLKDAVTRLVAISDDIGCRGLLVHAETEEARAFYLHLIPELESSPTDPLHLVLLMKDARRTLRGGPA